MNLTVITGTIPRYRTPPPPRSTSTSTSPAAPHTLHIRAINDLAKQPRQLHVDDLVAITGYMHADPYDMLDHSSWHRVEIVAHEAQEMARYFRWSMRTYAGRDMARMQPTSSAVDDEADRVLFAEPTECMGSDVPAIMPTALGDGAINSSRASNAWATAGRRKEVAETL